VSILEAIINLKQVTLVCRCLSACVTSLEYGLPINW